MGWISKVSGGFCCLTLKDQWFCVSVNFWELSRSKVWMHLCVGIWWAEYHQFVEGVTTKIVLQKVKRLLGFISCLAVPVAGSLWVGLLNAKYMKYKMAQTKCFILTSDHPHFLLWGVKQLIFLQEDIRFIILNCKHAKWFRFYCYIWIRLFY